MAQDRKEYLKNWRNNNKEYTKDYDKDYKEKNKEKLAAQGKVWRENNKEIIEPSEVELHIDVSKKLNLVGTKFAFFDFSTKVSTFKSKLKKLLLHTQSSGNEIDWTEKNYISN